MSTIGIHTVDTNGNVVEVLKPRADERIGTLETKTSTGAIGNGTYDNSLGYWSQVHLDSSYRSKTLERHQVSYDASSAFYDPITKFQASVQYNNSDPANAFNFTRVIGGYYEGIGSGNYRSSSDGATGNMTVLAATAHNKFAGNFGMTAISGRVWDAKESEVSNIGNANYGASKSCAGYFPFIRRSKYANGGYMIGIEAYCMNQADETSNIPYTNSDTWGSAFTSWTAGFHCVGYGTGAPITAGILIDGASGAKHAFYNGIVVGGSSMKINNVSQGASGTIGLSFASWSSTSYGETAIKFGRATRHLYFKEGAKIRANVFLEDYESGDCAHEICAKTGNVSKLILSVGATTAFSPTRTNNFVLTTNTGGSSVTYNAPRGSSHIFQHSGNNAYNLESSAFYSVGQKGLGRSGNLWSAVYAASGSINTSDARNKTGMAAVSDAVLDAWGDVEWRQFRFKDAVAEKGENARVHAGLVAQDVQAVFSAHGVDATRHGFFCFDQWGEEWTETQEEVSAAYVDEDGVEHAPEYRTVRTKTRDAGDAFAIRYPEALCLEAAYLRREIARIKTQIGMQ